MGYITRAFMGGPQRFGGRNQNTNAQNVDRWATSPLPFGGSTTLHSGEWNQKWPTHEHVGYITGAIFEGPLGFTMRDKYGGSPQVGTLATSPVPSWEVRNASERGIKSQWPTSGQISYLTLAVWEKSQHLRRREPNNRWQNGGTLATSPLSCWRIPNT